MKKGITGWRLLQRRECLLPTGRGCFLIVLAVSVLGAAFIKGIHPFLATNDPVYGGALVVEGWLPDYGFEQAIAEFKRHPYSKLYVTGGPLGQGSLLSEYRTFAELGAAVITRMGLSPDSLQAIPTPGVEKDRTYASAVALKNWMNGHEAGVPENIHVLSIGSHARRTRLLFKKAFGDSVKVGITAIGDEEYDPEGWWKTSAGARTVISEAIAYTYVRLFFWP